MRVDECWVPLMPLSPWGWDTYQLISVAMDAFKEPRVVNSLTVQRQQVYP